MGAYYNLLKTVRQNLSSDLDSNINSVNITWFKCLTSTKFNRNIIDELSFGRFLLFELYIAQYLLIWFELEAIFQKEQRWNEVMGQSHAFPKSNQRHWGQFISFTYIHTNIWIWIFLHFSSLIPCNSLYINIPFVSLYPSFVKIYCQKFV